MKNYSRFVCNFIKKKNNFPRKIENIFRPTMNLPKTPLIGILKAFYQTYFPTAYAVLLSGSVVDKKQHQKSDIDLVIFATDRDQCFNEDFAYEGHKIQVIVLAVQMLPTLLQQDYALGIGNQTGMIAKGKVVHDTDNYLTQLIKDCKKMYHAGPPQKPSEEIRLLYLDVVQLYQKIHASNFEDNFFQVPDLSVKLATLNLHYHRWWASRRKFLFEQLKTINPKLQKELFEATTHFFKTQSTQRLIEVVENNLHSFTDLKDLNSNNTGLSEVKGNELALCLQVHQNTMEQTVQQLRSFLKTLCYGNNALTFHIYRTFSGEYYLHEYDSLIAILRGDRAVLNGLLPVIYRTLHTPHYQLLRAIRYPANIDIRLGFGQNYGLVEGLFFEFGAFLSLQEKPTTTQKILLAIDVIVALGKANFQNSKQFLLFLKYVFTYWFPKSYDSGRIYGFYQITQSIADITSIFEQNATQQAAQLYPFVKPVLNWKTREMLLLPGDFNTHFSIKNTKPKNLETRSYQHHPIFDFLPSNVSITELSFLKNTAERLLGILLIEESQKAYIIYLIQALYEKK